MLFDWQEYLGLAGFPHETVGTYSVTTTMTCRT